MQMIIHHYKDSNKHPKEKALFYAICDKNTSEVQKIIDSGVNLNVLYEQGFTDTFITWAIRHGNTQTLNLLLNTDIDINALNDDDQTALTLAATEANAKAVNILLEKGANAAIGVPPLRQMVRNCYVCKMHKSSERKKETYLKIAKKLVLRGAVVDYERDYADNNLYWNSAPKELQDFLQKELDYEKEEKQKEKQNEKQLSFLGKLAQKALPKQDESAFVEAVLSNNLEQAKKSYPVRSERFINAVDRGGRTLLHRIAGLGFAEMTKFLIDCGMDVCAQDKEGKTPIDYATAFGNKAVCTELLKTGKVQLPFGYELYGLIENKETVEPACIQNETFFNELQEKRKDTAQKKYKKMDLDKLKEGIKDKSFLEAVCRENALLAVARQLSYKEQMKLRVDLFRHKIGSKKQLKELDAFISEHNEKGLSDKLVKKAFFKKKEKSI